VVGRWTCDREVAGSTPGCRIAGQQLWASCSHPCASVTKQYNSVLAKGRWCSAAGKVIVDLASHWPCITDSVVYLPTGSKANVRKVSTLPMSHWSMVPFTFFYLVHLYSECTIQHCVTILAVSVMTVTTCNVRLLNVCISEKNSQFGMPQDRKDYLARSPRSALGC